MFLFDGIGCTYYIVEWVTSEGVYSYYTKKYNSKASYKE